MLRLLNHDVINIWNFQLESSQDSLIEVLVNQKAKHEDESLRFDELRAPTTDAGAKAIGVLLTLDFPPR